MKAVIDACKRERARTKVLMMKKGLDLVVGRNKLAALDRMEAAALADQKVMEDAENQSRKTDQEADSDGREVTSAVPQS